MNKKTLTKIRIRGRDYKITDFDIFGSDNRNMRLFSGDTVIELRAFGDSCQTLPRGNIEYAESRIAIFLSLLGGLADYGTPRKDSNGNEFALLAIRPKTHAEGGKRGKKAMGKIVISDIEYKILDYDLFGEAGCIVRLYTDKAFIDLERDMNIPFLFDFSPDVEYAIEKDERATWINSGGEEYRLVSLRPFTRAEQDGEPCPPPAIDNPKAAGANRKSSGGRTLSESEQAALVEKWLAEPRTSAELAAPMREDYHPDAVFNPPKGATFGFGTAERGEPEMWQKLLIAEMRRRDLLKDGIRAIRRGAEVLLPRKTGRPPAVSQVKKERILAYVRELEKSGAGQMEACIKAAREKGGLRPPKPETIRGWLKQENKARAGK